MQDNETGGSNNRRSSRETRQYPQWELNPRPATYKDAALPLSYGGWRYARHIPSDIIASPFLDFRFAVEHEIT